MVGGGRRRGEGNGGQRVGDEATGVCGRRSDEGRERRAAGGAGGRVGEDEATRRQCDKPKLTRFKESVDIKRQPPWTARKKSWKLTVKRSS
jgi:hypothetical protein